MRIIGACVLMLSVVLSAASVTAQNASNNQNGDLNMIENTESGTTSTTDANRLHCKNLKPEDCEKFNNGQGAPASDQP